MSRLAVVFAVMVSFIETVSAGCSAYPMIENGIVTYNPLLPQLSYDVGSMAMLSCNLGFVPSGPRSTKCTEQGHWHPSLGSCKPVHLARLADMQSQGLEYSDGYTCGPVNHEMGTITYLPGPEKPTFNSGAIAVLSCPPGQAVTGGASQAICQGGKWSATLGSCKQANMKIF